MEGLYKLRIRESKEVSSWSRIRERNSANKEVLEIVVSWSPTDSILEERTSLNLQNRHSRILLHVLFIRQNERNASRTRSPRDKSPSDRMSRIPCKTYLKKELASNSFCKKKKWHPPECLFYKSESDCRFDEKYSFTHRHVEEEPSKRSQKECFQKYSDYDEVE